ncbi:hypothetical protein NDU88_003363 [Pleurodeles waltl]|uniref:Uncharacterized protein n=1 Tax=Pleurodeles waltl TaxID=8319 RepID=A0AAV7UYQ4_PLEWA|nr:hypothetical protein NDU88_003363 [Pleurodeles waltl]
MGPFRALHINFNDMIDRCANYQYLIVVVGPYCRRIEASPCMHCEANAMATSLVREVKAKWDPRHRTQDPLALGAKFKTSEWKPGKFKGHTEELLLLLW